MLFHGLGREDVDEYAARVTKVDAAAVRSTIEQSFPQPADLVIVLIGDAATIRDAVKKYGPVTEMKIIDPRFSPATK
jgi:zinc protease